MAHVINLAAHDGIKVFGADTGVDDNGEAEITLGRMDLANLIDPPNGQNLNLQSIVSRLHGLATYVRGSPQRREGFEAAVDLVTSQSNSETSVLPRMLILDVKTRWNSTYDMLNRALQLRSVCMAYCGGRGNAFKFALNDDEWDKVDQMTKFLSPSTT